MSELKKISAYVPEELYDCLEKDKEEGKISLSQAIIAALANHYNIEVTVGKSGRRVTLGGETATVERVEALENKFAEFSSNITEQIEQVLSAIQSNQKSTNGVVVNHEQTQQKVLTVKNSSIDKLLQNQEVEILPEKKITPNNTQLTLETTIQIKPLTTKLLASRLEVYKNTPANRKSKFSIEEFEKWSMEKDPNNIPWIPNPDGKGYLPSEKVLEGQLIELQKWIEKQND